jgi:alkylation response protein AidB-like acyl-CoA dehydrogenase
VDGLHIRAHKSWVTSANVADVYVVSTLTARTNGPTMSDLYLVDRRAPGVTVAGQFDGIGLRGNDSAPVELDIAVSDADRLGAEGAGLQLMTDIVLPSFSLGNAAVSCGFARAALDLATTHVSATRHEHFGTTLADLPTVRAYLAKVWADAAAHRALVDAAASALSGGADDAMLMVMAAKAACNESVLRVVDTAMRITGGAGFSRHLPVERFARDARAGQVMAPTSDALFDFIGRALCGMDLFG